MRLSILLVSLLVGACKSPAPPPQPIVVATPVAPSPAESAAPPTYHGHIATPEEAASFMSHSSADAGTFDATSEPIPGRIPPEVIKRVIRAGFPKFRKCYETALVKTKGKAKGTIVSTYVIGLDGTIEVIHSFAQDPSIPKSMVDCISVEYLKLVFPEPIGGKVRITYPLDFQNEE